MTGRPHLDQHSPGAAFLGREILEVDRATGDVRLAFLARAEFANRHGTLFGGFLAAMLDSACAAPILASLPEDHTIVTTELHVSYARPAPLGRLFAVGRVSERNDREIHSAAQLEDPSGVVVATATATFRVLPRR
jgi:uncharacterized protein (TIGR00369 family)